MKNNLKLNGTIKIEGINNETWVIEQDDNNRFYITSSNGYNQYEGNGHSSLVSAITHVNKMIASYYEDRCLEKPIL